jgi:cellulose synthase/poly-beta-1,6-N-acetylglucosamine synthase-like glycosyltransferase
MNNLPFVSIIIPCRNEEGFIGKCLDSLIANDYPKDKMEIIVVDGASTDKTKEILKNYTREYAFIRLIENPKKITPISVNMGIMESKGDIVTKTDAHSEYPADYISKSIKYMEEYKADIVGSIAYATPSTNTLSARAIVEALKSKISGGGSFRNQSGKPIWTDTVFGPFIKREVIKKIGLFNERLARSQDMDFGMRATKSGAKILLVPEIMIDYHPKSTIIGFLKHNFQDGIWAILPLKYGAPMFKIRHILPLLFVSTLVALKIAGFFFTPFWALLLFIEAAYISVISIESIKISAREKDHRLFPYLIAAFIARHFGYGLGSMVGIIKLILPEEK